MPPPGPEPSKYWTQPDQEPEGLERERAVQRPEGLQRERAVERLDGLQRERAVQELAARQHGVVSLPQLKALGLSSSAVRTRVALGKLLRLHRGVYAIGLGQRSVESTYMAAVLACGPNAVLSHRSAADRLGMRRSSRAAVDVTVPSRAGKQRRGIDVHRATGLTERDVTTVNGIPCTTVARTLLDLATKIDMTALERAIEQADKLEIFDPSAVIDVTNRAGNRRGATTLEGVLKAYTPEPAFIRSELEKRFLALCRTAGLPLPRTNNVTGSDEIDFTWPDRRLMVEADSLRHHGTRAAFERDRRRDQRLTMAGWRVVRFTWRQVDEEAEEVAATLRSLLAG